jgi:predicted transposase YdaD
MAGDFDATLKTLVEAAPQDWLAFVGAPPGEARVIDADVSSIVGAQADKVIRVEAAEPYLVHLEFQAGHDGPLLPARLAR